MQAIQEEINRDTINSMRRTLERCGSQLMPSIAEQLRARIALYDEKHAKPVIKRDEGKLELVLSDGMPYWCYTYQNKMRRYSITNLGYDRALLRAEVFKKRTLKLIV